MDGEPDLSRVAPEYRAGAVKAGDTVRLHAAGEFSSTSLSEVLDAKRPEIVAGLRGPCRACGAPAGVPCKGLPTVTWAPYQEFGIPDPAAEEHESPPGPVVIGAVAYRGHDVIIYWSREETGEVPD